MQADSVHHHDAVIERWVTDSVAGVQRVISAEVTTYKKFATQQYVPYQRFVFSNPTPVTNFAPSTVRKGELPSFRR